MNFVCTGFEQGDEMLPFLSMEKTNGRIQPITPGVNIMHENIDICTLDFKFYLFHVSARATLFNFF